MLGRSHEKFKRKHITATWKRGDVVTYGRSDRKNERRPVLEIWTKKNVGYICHEQENGRKSSAGCCKLRNHERYDICYLAEALVDTQALENLAGK